MASIIKVNTIQDATNSNTAMTIDSSGRITEPQKPSVTVDISSSGYINVSNTNPIPFNNVQFSQIMASYEQNDHYNSDSLEWKQAHVV